MRRIDVDGVTLEYAVHGRGADPVVLIHGAHLADSFLPLVAEPALSRYRLIHYHRRGFAGSSRCVGGVTVADHAADCARLLRRLGLERVHVVGHSYGGVIALQLALDAPQIVHSLVLLEPALLPLLPCGPPTFRQLAPLVEMYERGDAREAVEAFLEVIGGPTYRSVVEHGARGGIEQAVQDADTFFLTELPSLEEWRLVAEDVKAIAQPVLYVLGDEGEESNRQGRELVGRWLPQTEEAVLPGTTHLMQTENPRGVAEASASFFDRHPLPHAQAKPRDPAIQPTIS